MTLTPERLKELIHYDPETGLITRIKAPGGPQGERWCGPVHSLHRDGYITFRIKRKKHKGHRLAWLYVYGEWPKGHLDHINGIRHDNRIANLRLADYSQNRCNAKRNSNNTSGYKGVSKHSARGQWKATIQSNRQSVHLGWFASPEAAHAAYCAAAKRLHGEFARTD